MGRPVQYGSLRLSLGLPGSSKLLLNMYKLCSFSMYIIYVDDLKQ